MPAMLRNAVIRTRQARELRSAVERLYGLSAHLLDDIGDVTHQVGVITPENLIVPVKLVALRTDRRPAPAWTPAQTGSRPIIAE